MCEEGRKRKEGGWGRGKVRRVGERCVNQGGREGGREGRTYFHGVAQGTTLLADAGGTFRSSGIRLLLTERVEGGEDSLAALCEGREGGREGGRKRRRHRELCVRTTYPRSLPPSLPLSRPHLLLPPQQEQLLDEVLL